jgi:hypothetical protein
MKATKIKAVRDYFDNMSGPYQEVTLGFQADGESFILGSFYLGPDSPKDLIERQEKIECIINAICRASER